MCSSCFPTTQRYLTDAGMRAVPRRGFDKTTSEVTR
jgi:hypothetical protein